MWKGQDDGAWELRQLAWIHACRFRQAHCNVGREIAVAGITRTFHRCLEREIGYGISQLGQCCKSVLNEICD